MRPDVLRQRIVALDDGGDFTNLPRTYPYSVINPAAGSNRVIYATKAHTVSELLYSIGAECSVGMVGRYGLPDEADIPWLVDYARDKSVCFLGDCDPFDLLIFAWLRSFIAIEYLGVSDAAVNALGVAVSSNTIPLDAVEKRAFPLLQEALPDLSRLVGAACTALLQANQKLEIEGMLNFNTRPHANLLKLLPGN